MTWDAPDLLPPPAAPSASPTPPSPPPAGPERDGRTRSGVPAATWIALLGGALVLLAASSVVVANWDAIGRSFRVLGLVVGTGVLVLASERVRRVAPTTANIVAHVGTLLTATVGVATLSLFGVTWPGCLVAGGTLALAATMWQADRWSPSLFRAAQVGAIALAATGLGELSGTTGGLVAALAAVGLLALGADRRAAGLAVLAVSSPVLTGLAEAGIGHGTLERAGLVGERLGWSGPVVGVLAALVLVVVGRRRQASVLVTVGALAPVVGIVTGLAAIDGSVVAWLCVPALAILAGDLARWAAPSDRWLVPITETLDLVAGVAAGVTLLAPIVVAEVALDSALEFAWAAPVAFTAFAMAVVTTRWLRADDRLVDLGIAAVASLSLAGVISFGIDPAATSTVAVAIVAAAAFASRRLHPVAIGVPAVWALVEMEQLSDDVGSWRWWLGITGAAAVLGLVVLTRARRAAESDVSGWVEMGVVTLAGALVAAVFAETGELTAGLVGAVAVGTAITLTDRRWVALHVAAVAVPGLLALDAAFNGLASGTRAWAGWVIATAGFAAAGVVHRDHISEHAAAAATVLTGTAATAVLGWQTEEIVTAAMVTVAAATGLALTLQRRSPIDSAAVAAGIVLAVAASFTAYSPWWSGAWVVLGLQVTAYGLAMRQRALTGLGAIVGAVATASWWFTTGLDEWFRDLVAPLDVTATDAWLFVVTSIALVVGWLARQVFGVNSWIAYSVGLYVGGFWLIGTQIERDPVWALPAAITFGVVAVGSGAWHRLAAPLVGGTVVTAGSTFVALGSDLSAIPTWSWLAAGGLALLATAVTIERTTKQGTSFRELVDDWQ